MNANTPKITRASLTVSPDVSGISPQPVRHEAGGQATSGWGCQPICSGCNRGAIYSCICNIPDPEPEYFKPGGNYDPDAGWAFAERSAFGMGVAK